VSALFFPFCVVVFNDAAVAVAVSLALFATCGVASAVALLLPWLLNLLDKDPAFGAGPLATVLQDLLSIAIYLALASSTSRPGEGHLGIGRCVGSRGVDHLGEEGLCSGYRCRSEGTNRSATVRTVTQEPLQLRLSNAGRSAWQEC
jgi:hypothetical protein